MRAQGVYHSARRRKTKGNHEYFDRMLGPLENARISKPGVDEDR
jgi:hypothetical protein